jgi:tRNA dimethylallyltransferase
VNSGISCPKKDIKQVFSSVAIQAQKQLVSKFSEPIKKVIVISGPTSVGKTAFSIELARLISGEIISADSMQVYKGMDIGTAKATPSQQQQVPHHLLDIRNISDPFNVVDFFYEARHCCEKILARGKVPIVVGGSGFYLHALLYGPPSGPPSIPEVRGRIEEKLHLLGVETLFQELKKKDPEYAATITKRDKQKIVRALEIIELTEKKVSSIEWKEKHLPENYRFHCWYLFRPKNILAKLIEDRCEEMITSGFLDEVERLLREGLLENPSAAQAIGYRQAIEYLKNPSEEAHAEFARQFKKATKNYVKRQMTWFKKEPIFRWLDLELHDKEVALDIIIQDYQATL